MFYILQNESTAARRRVPILLTDAATGTTAQTGVATTNIFPYVAINGNAFIGGTGSLGEAGFGQYYYEFEANEVATLGLAGIHITAAGCRDYDAIAQIAAFDLYSASGAGASSYAIAEEVWNFDISGFTSNAGGYVININDNVNDAKSNTNNIPLQVWGDDLAAGANSPYAAGTAGTILYELGIGTTGTTSAEIWSYATRTITGGIADTVTLVTSPVEISYPSMAGLANTIWSSDVSGYTSPSAGFDLTQSASGTALTSGDVWSYATRTITGGIADTVTTLTDRSGFAITGGTVDTVTNAVNVSTASMAGIANTVWSTLTAPYTTHATFGHQILRSDNAATIGEVTLHQSGGSKRVDADVHAFINNTASATAMLNILTGIGASMTTNITGNITGNLSGSVGSVTSPVDVSTSSMSGIANTVWATDISGYTSPSAGFDLSNVAGGGITAGDVWTYATREITGGIADTVTTVSGNVLGSVNSVVTDVNISTGTQASIANSVWSADVSGYTSPSAGFDLANASSGSGISAADVWNYTLVGNSQTADTTLVDIQNQVTSTLPTSTAASVWSYTLPNSQFAENALVAAASGVTAGDVWEYDISAISTAGTAGSQLNLAASPSGAGLTSGDVSVAVWDADPANYSNNSTFGKGILRSDNAGVAGTVSLWTGGAFSGVYADTYRIDADYGAATALRDVLTGIGASITGNITGDLSGSVGSVTADVNVSTSSMTGIAGTVWSTDISGYTSPSAGFDLANASSGSGLTAGDVWTYASREITGGIADTVTTVTNGVTVTTNNDKTGYALSSTQTFDVTGNISGSVGSVTNPVTFDSAQYSGIASSVWNAATRTLTSSGSGISAYDVWNFDPTAMTSPQAGAILTDIQTDTNTIITDIGNIPNNVWASDVSGYSTPGEAGFELSQAAAGAGLTSGDVWSYATRTITGGIADTVTTITDRSGFAITGGTVDTVTNPVTFDSVQYAGIASSVWNAATRTLTSSGSGISAFDVWNFVLSDSNTAEVDLVQAAAGSGLTAGDVWSAPSRTITGGIADTVTTLTNRSGFAITGGTVDNVTNGVTVSTNNDKTGYSLSGSQSFNLTGNITGNLSGSVGSVTSGVTVTTNNDKTGYALSGAGVSAVQSGLSTLTQAQVGTEVDASLVDVGLTTTVTGRIDATVSSRLASASYVAPPTEAAIAGTVWGYANRTLTSGAGASAGDVWTYATRSLTSGAGITVNAATNIINGPYFVKSNVDGQDGNLDVIRGMVQDIQLTVTDAFQNPFDVTALGLAVNFYDQAGTLVTSYGTSNLYAPAGLVQFTLDTAVTSNEGRYNLILSAAGSGNTIKFGPLQTLVRPF